MAVVSAGAVRQECLPRDDVFPVRLDLDNREARRVPAAAERLNQQNAGDETLSVDDRKLLLVLEQVLLRGDDVEVVDQAHGDAVEARIAQRRKLARDIGKLPAFPAGAK